METRQEMIIRLQICKCGHTRKNHGEEPPYECEMPSRDGTTFRCDCRGFEYKRVEPDQPTTGS